MSIISVPKRSFRRSFKFDQMLCCHDFVFLYEKTSSTYVNRTPYEKHFNCMSRRPALFNNQSIRREKKTMEKAKIQKRSMIFQNSRRKPLSYFDLFFISIRQMKSVISFDLSESSTEIPMNFRLIMQIFVFCWFSNWKTIERKSSFRNQLDRHVLFDIRTINKFVSNQR